MKIIQLTGTPCTGKTTLAKSLSKSLKDSKYINITSFIKKYKAYENYDKKKKCYIVDEKELRRIFIDEIKEKKKQHVIVDSHILFLTKSKLDLVIVVNCELKKLELRLNKRRYSKTKIKENLECEIFDYCYYECLRKKYKKIIKIQNNTRQDIKNNLRTILQEISKL